MMTVLRSWHFIDAVCNMKGVGQTELDDHAEQAQWALNKRRKR
jgi:hypothetical protein